MAGLYELHARNLAQQAKGFEESQTQTVEATQKALKAEWKGAYDAQMNLANRTLIHLAGDRSKEVAQKFGGDIDFIKLMAIATLVMFSFWMASSYLQPEQPGDYHVRQGDIYLTSGNYEDALESFSNALEEMPDHRGALMGRGISFLQLDRFEDAEAEFTYLIGYLKKTLKDDDRTGIGVLAAAYTNRGILYDRTARYELALADYFDALKIDEDLLSGPGIVDKVIFGTPDPATVRGRAIYIKDQLTLPEGQRVMKNPEADEKQRMYKP